jgi:hypothetical protein
MYNTGMVIRYNLLFLCRKNCRAINMTSQYVPPGINCLLSMKYASTFFRKLSRFIHRVPGWSRGFGVVRIKSAQLLCCGHGITSRRRRVCWECEGQGERGGCTYWGREWHCLKIKCGDLGSCI